MRSTFNVDIILFLFYERKKMGSMWRSGLMVSEGQRREMASQILVLVTRGAQFYFLPFVSKTFLQLLKLSLWSVRA